MRLVGISGSLRRGSFNTALIDAAAAELPQGAELVRLSEFALRLLPFYDEALDARDAVPAAIALRRTLAEADAVLIATPEYNGSMPGALKNLLDWASRPYPGNCLLGKRVGVVGASTGYFGAAWAQGDLRRVLEVIGADVLETTLRLPAAHTAFDANGKLRDPALAAALRSLVRQLLPGRPRPSACRPVRPPTPSAARPAHSGSRGPTCGPRSAAGDLVVPRGADLRATSRSPRPSRRRPSP